MSDDGNDDSSCDVVSVVECIVAPVGLASHGGIINFSGVNIAPSDCVCATQHERCLSPLKEPSSAFWQSNHSTWHRS